MTTRAQLESEREALRRLLADCRGSSHPEVAEDAGALTASIARVEALLSLDDGSVYRAVALLRREAGDCAEDDETYNEDLHAVANLIRREPQGDV